MSSRLTLKKKKGKKRLKPKRSVTLPNPTDSTNNINSKEKKVNKRNHQPFDEIKRQSKRNLHYARGVKAFIFPFISFSGPMRHMCSLQ